MVKYPKLKGRIIEKYGTQRAFADALGIDKATLSNKMTGKNMFSQEEILLSMELLNIEDVTPYFFEKEVG